MNYVVIEIQSAESVSTLINTYDNRNDAYSKYYTILSYAAVSSVPTHSAVILTEQGDMVEHKFFTHSS